MFRKHGMFAVCLLLGWQGLAQAELRLQDESVSSSIAFEWDEVQGADRYVLCLGSSAGTRDLGARGARDTRKVLNQLPTDGRDIHATLRARVDGRWRVDSELKFTASDSPLIYSPSNIEYGRDSSIVQFRGAAARFAWTSPRDEAAANYLLMAGTLEDPDAYGRRRAVGDDLFVSLSDLPVDGSPVWLTLLWRDHLNQRRKEAAVEFQASESDSISYPIADTRLPGSMVVFDLRWPEGVKKSRIRVGTVESPNAYGVWSGYHGRVVTALPTDGSDVIARHDVFDGRRWVNASQQRYLAGLRPDYLWGDCSEASLGRRLGRRAEVRFRPGEEVAISRATVLGVGKTGFDPKLYRILSDGCASDTAYVTLDSINVYMDSSEKGLMLWLAPSSGAASVEYYNTIDSSGPLHTLAAIHPADGIDRPVFIPLLYAQDFNDGLFHGLSIRSLDKNKPVKISEIRSVALDTPVEAYRKLRVGGRPILLP